VERLRPFAERQGVTLAIEAPDGLPPVRGEAARLAQVFANLVHNAVKFSPAGTEVRVEVGSGERRTLEARVRDEGPGIAAADQPRIFERFYKADRTRTAGGGTGLGLAIARHIVEGHGGAIRVESDEGRGATFAFTIPMSDAAREPAGAGESRA
jgi:two-component system phosphate regulon sensor histidine kinase PhoR